MLYKPCRSTLSNIMYIAIYGKTGIGKTRYAYAVACELYGEENVILVRTLEDLRNYKRSHRCIIFDDISFEYKKPELLIHLCDRYFDAPVRILRKSIAVNKETVKIFTHNNKEAFTPFLATLEQIDAIRRRLKIIQVQESCQIIRELQETLTQSN